MDNRYFSLKLVEWYEQNHRKLPWRETKDPYKIWLSEIILQQTRVVQGLPYYLKFVERFPTVNDLAIAKEQEILRLWQGLGYYTRARNLHKCAKVVMSDYQGKFPTTFLELLTLPGIGEYTAAAISSIAFHEPVAVIDGNVYRVLSRIFGIDKNISLPDGKSFFKVLANSLVHSPRPDFYNQALMEFGALHCTPKQPNCEQCVFKDSCIAKKSGLQLSLPVKSKPKKSRNRYITYFVLANKKGIAMKKRNGVDIWRGLYDFLEFEAKRSKSYEKILADPDVKKILGKKSPSLLSKQYKHVLSHQNIYARFIVVEDSSTIPKDSGLRFYSKKQINDLPKPILIHRFLLDHIFYS